MSPSGVRLLTRTLIGSGLALGTIFMALVARTMLHQPRPTFLLIDRSFVIVLVLGAAWVAFLIDRRHPGHTVALILAAIGFGAGVEAAATLYGYQVLVVGWDMPLGDAVAWMEVPVLIPLFGLGFGLLPLVFPAGRLPSPRWRPVVWMVGLGAVAYLAGVFLTDVYSLGGEFVSAAWATDPFVVEGLPSTIGRTLAGAGLVTLPIALTLAGVSLVLRYRAAGPVERRQIKWFVFFGVPTVLGHVLMLGPFGPATEVMTSTPLGPLMATMAIGAIGIAILRHRLYDIDLVINRTLVYGSLAVMIGGVYVVVVVGIGNLVGTRGEPDTTLTLVATAMVAIIFQPARGRLQRLANRIVFGERADPYQVLADFSHRLGGALEAPAVLPRIAETTARAVAAPQAEVAMLLPDGGARLARWPDGGRGEAALTVDIRHRGELVGRLSVAARPGDPFQDEERELLHRIAHQSGVALHNARLTAQLEERLQDITERADELKASRRRLVEARDRERRRVEAEITRRTEPAIAAVRRLVGEAVLALKHEPARASELLEQARVETQRALDGLREIARGIYPPLLEDRGLVAAIEADLRKLQLPSSLGADGLRGLDLPAEVQAAAYFCCREALENVVRHAGAARVEVDVGLDGSFLRAGVTDDGVGFDPGAPGDGTGLQLMADRVAAIGGRMDIESRRGGTRITLEIPVQGQAAEPEADLQAPVSVSGSNSDFGM